MSKLRDIWNVINGIFSAIRERREKKASAREFRRRMASLERENRHWYDVARLVQ